jgi:tRNA splicing endonuclease
MHYNMHLPLCKDGSKPRKQKELKFIDEYPIIRSMSDHEAVLKESIRYGTNLSPYALVMNII